MCALQATCRGGSGSTPSGPEARRLLGLGVEVVAPGPFGGVQFCRRPREPFLEGPRRDWGSRRRDTRQLISDCVVAPGHVPELESVEVAIHTPRLTYVRLHLRVGALVFLGDLIHDQLGIA